MAYDMCGWGDETAQVHIPVPGKVMDAYKLQTLVSVLLAFLLLPPKRLCFQ